MAASRNNRILILNEDPLIHDHLKCILRSHPSSEMVGSSNQLNAARQSFRTTSVNRCDEAVAQIEQAIKQEDPFAVAFVGEGRSPKEPLDTTIARIWEAAPCLQIVVGADSAESSTSQFCAHLGVSDQLLVVDQEYNPAEIQQVATVLSKKWQLQYDLGRCERDRYDRILDAEDRLHQKSQHLELAANLAELSYWAFDVQTKELTLSSNTTEILGIKRAPTHLHDLIQLFTPSDHAQLKIYFEAAVRTGKGFDCTTSRSIDCDRPRHFQLRGKGNRDQAGNLKYSFGVIQDVTHREEAMERIRHASLHDTLTELPNRLRFVEQSGRALQQSQRSRDVAHLVLLGIDQFQSLNDSYGHAVGDAILKQFAQRLSTTTRKSDVVARLSGNEFAILQTCIRAPGDTIAMLERINEMAQRPFCIDGKSISVTFCCGIAMAPDNGRTINELMRAANLALCRAKDTGASTWSFFDPSVDQSLQSRRQTQLDLESAVKNKHFQLNYQPILATQTRKVTGMEALIRWNHPERGSVPPDEFIDVAESSGAIVDIGNWVLNQACRDAAKWPGETQVAVNVSPVQFSHDNILASVSQALSNSKLHPNRLELEITESIFLHPSNETLATLHSLREMGVRIVMDDFGSGYSSLSYLRSFPFDKLKLDKSFVLDSEMKDESRVIIDAVSGLGSSLGMATCAEGVETEEHFERIRRAGYTHTQGFLFGKPKPLAEIPDEIFSQQIGPLASV